ncbi:hypothetical protein D9613_006182 [Agrocybe pediades]|uniref:Uncharacterized protein n=1 Tax=Agrocybe pediades TaxID=84607 RepID=A0A8H4VRM2_9AGAR|nr:hypothetical protein D9613_006182 [Agrocybe pediades]
MDSIASCGRPACTRNRGDPKSSSRPQGSFISVSETTSIDGTSGSGKVLYPKSAYDQILTIFAEIVFAIEALGGTKSSVVRLRMFVAEEKDGEGVSKALKEVFGEVAPAATMLFGTGFVNREMKVEIEADAVDTTRMWKDIYSAAFLSA